MDDDIMEEFLAECWENLTGIDNQIISLKTESPNADLLASIFRTIHTINGTCGFIGLTDLGLLAHATENVVGQMRDQLISATPCTISVLLEAVEEIRSFLLTLEATGQEPQHDITDLIARLNNLTPCDELSSSHVSPTGAEFDPATHNTELTCVIENPPAFTLEVNAAPLDSMLLQESFNRLAPQSDRLAKRFFEKLIQDYPLYESLFGHTDFADLRQKFIQALALVVKSSNRPGMLTRFLHDLGLQHREYGISRSDYASFRATLLAVLEEFSASHWTDERQSAWEVAAKFITDQMQSADKHFDHSVQYIQNHHSSDHNQRVGTID